MMDTDKQSYIHTTEHFGFCTVGHTILDSDRNVLAESLIETVGRDEYGDVRTENGTLDALVREWFPMQQHEDSEDPHYRKFVDSFFFYGDGTDGIDHNGEGDHAVSINAGIRAKRKLQLMYSPDVLNQTRRKNYYARKDQRLTQREARREYVYSTSDDPVEDGTQQTNQVTEFDLMYARDRQSFMTAPSNDPIHDTPKQKLVTGRKYLAECLGVNERTVRRMVEKGELVSAVRGELNPSRISHMKTRSWVSTVKKNGSPAMGGNGYVCSTAPSFEDKMIDKFDSGLNATGLESAPTYCEWPNPTAAAGWANREGVNDDGTRWFVDGWWMGKNAKGKDQDDRIRWNLAPAAQ